MTRLLPVLYRMIIFRCNAGPEIGFGHLIRCRALALALREHEAQCVMVGPPVEYATTADIDTFVEWIPKAEWDSAMADAKDFVDIARRFDATWAVLDDYRVDENYQGVVRDGGLRWLQFDGTATKPLWADLVVNANPAASERDYQPVLRNPETRLLLGPRYAILRPEFTTVQQGDPGRPVRQVLVTFGGGDDRGAIQCVLSSLLPATPSTVRFLVISGRHNPRNPSLVQWIEAHGQGRVSLHIDPPQVALSMANCDLAVMAGGTSTAEAAACGLPMLLIAIAENQIHAARAWEKSDAAVFLGRLEDLCKDPLAKAFQRLVSDHEHRHALCQAGRQLCDGAGAVRVARTMIPSEESR